MDSQLSIKSKKPKCQQGIHIPAGRFIKGWLLMKSHQAHGVKKCQSDMQAFNSKTRNPVNELMPLWFALIMVFNVATILLWEVLTVVTSYFFFYFIVKISVQTESKCSWFSGFDEKTKRPCQIRTASGRASCLAWWTGKSVFSLPVTEFVWVLLFTVIMWWSFTT